MSARRKYETRSLFAFALFPVMLAASGAMAQVVPTGATIVSGSATFDNSVAGTTTINQSSGKAIINWTDFSIGAGGTVLFNNGVGGATLNRVTSTNVSNIAGALYGQGSVYLINPNGIIIGGNGVVGVGGSFIGSSLDLTNASFLAGGDLTFVGSGSALVANFGQVSALGGDVVLMATGEVINDGTARADNGTAALLSGTRILMRDNRLNDGKFVVETGGGNVTSGTSSLIAAAQVELRSNNGNVLAMAGNNPSIEATSVSTIDGRVFLTANTGNVRVEGQIFADINGSGGRVLTASGSGTVSAGQNAFIGANQWTLQGNALTLDRSTIDAIGTTFGNVNNAIVSVISTAGDLNVGSLTASTTLFNLGGGKLNLSATGDVRLFSNLDTAAGATTNIRSDADANGVGRVVPSGAFRNTGAVNIYSSFAYSDFAAENQVFQNRRAGGAAAPTLYALVNSYADLNRMGDSTVANYALGRDIDASASVGTAYNITDLGTGLIFDGLGHSISNLTINRPVDDEVGLFSNVSGTIQNVNLVGGAITGNDSVGALAAVLVGGTIRGSSASATVVGNSLNVGGLIGFSQNGSISNNVFSGSVTGFGGVGGILGYGGGVTSVGNLSTGSISGNNEVGGLIGYMEGGSSTNDVATGNVSGFDYVGGLIGHADSAATISAGSARGIVVGNEGVGGLVGFLDGGTIQGGSYASGNVTGSFATGGLVGDLAGAVTGSNATGIVTGFQNVGGLVGYGHASASIATSYAEGAVNKFANNGGNLGGLVGGWFGTGSISESYATGAVSAANNDFVGGLIGYLQDGQFSDIYATGAVTGRDYVGGLIGYAYASDLAGVTIQNGYSSGAVTGSNINSYVGGLLGYADGLGNTITLTNLYYDFETSGQGSGVGEQTVANVNGNVLDLSTTAAFQLSSYVGFDQTKWVQLDGKTRPMLAFEVAQADVNGVRTINSIHQLQLLGYGAADNDATLRYVLGRDIDAAQTSVGASSVFGTRGFSSLQVGPTYYVGFAGRLDGQGHQISGLTINGSSSASNSVGLFELIASNGVVRDLSLVGGTINGNFANSLTGSIAGHSAGTIVDVRSSATVNGAAGVYTGGLVGWVTGGLIDRSAYVGAVSGGNSAGGIAGDFQVGLIRNSYVSGSVTGGDAVGGIIGSASFSSTLQSVLTTATLTGDPANTGVLAGLLVGDLTITNARYSTSSSAGVPVIGQLQAGTFASNDVAGFTNAQLQDQNTLAAVYGSGFDFNTIWAPASGADQTTGGAHFAELYRADNVLFVDGRGNRSVYGDTPGAINLTYRGLRDGDTVVRNASATTNAMSTSNANLSGANYFVTITGGSAQRAGGGDYRVVRVGDLTVTQRVVTASLGGSVNRVYDATTAADLSGTTLTVNGLVNGDGARVGATATTGVFDTKNVGTGKTVTSTGDVTLTGTGASNYIIAGNASGAIGTITPATLGTVTLAAQGKVYDGTTAASIDGSTLTVAGVLGDDDIGFDDADGTYNSKNVQGATTVTATGLTLNGDDAGNYVLASTTVMGTGSISARNLSTSLNNITKVYDGTTTANLTQANYGLNYFGQTGVIAGDDVTATNTSANYDTKNVAVTQTCFMGMCFPATGHNVTVNGIALSGADASNYTVSSSTSGKVGQITAKQLIAEVTGSTSRVYDATTNASIAGLGVSVANQIIAGDMVTAATTATSAAYADRNAGTAKQVQIGGVTITGNDAANYTVANTAVGNVGTITPASVTASLGGTAMRTYDGTTAAPTANTTVSLAGVYGIDTVTAAATSATYDTKDAGTGKTVTATVGLGGTNAGNYVLASNTASAAIGQIDRAILTALLSGPVSRVYDTTTTASVGASNLGLSGIVSGDAVSVGVTGATYDTANAGTSKAVTATGLTLSGTGAINYSLASTSVTANIGTVTQRALTASLTGTTTKTYDATTTAALLAGNYALAGVLAGDTVTLNNPTVGAYADANAGTGKTVNVNGLAIGGSSAGNYTVNASASGSIGTINAKALTAALTGTTSRTYDATTTAALTGSNYSLSGVIAGDTVTLNNPTIGSYADANAGTAKTVNVNGLALGGAAAGNYTVNASASGAIGTINAKALTAALTGTTSRTYDATTTAALTGSNYSLSGVIAGDTVTLNNPTVGSYADANAGTAKTVNVNGLALGGTSAGNYTVNASASGAIGTINAKALTAALTGTTSRTYDATTTAALTGSNYSLSGVIAGDTVTLNNPTVGSYADANVGTAKTVSVNGLALGGAAAGNYTVNASASGAIGTILQRALTAGLTGTTTRVYDGTTTATLTGSNYSLSGVLAGDTVTLNTPTTGVYADRNVGTAKTVTINGLVIGGSSAGNYSLASTTTSGAIGVITPRGITITADAKEKNRNDVDPALTSSITTGSLVQGDSLTGALTRASGEAVGTYAITQGTLSAGTNYAVTFNGATFTIALGIPPIDDTLFPIVRPSDGFGGGGVVSGAAQADVTGATPGLSFVEQVEQADAAEEDASLDQICSADEVCPVAPYPSSGFTSASIRFEGYSR